MCTGNVRRTAAIAVLGAVVALLAACGAPATDPPAATGQPLWVSVRGHTVSLDARDVSRREIIQALAREADLRLVMRESLDERLSVQFHDLAVPAAVRRLLRHRSFALDYAGPARPAGRAAGTLWVFATATAAARDTAQPATRFPGAAPGAGPVAAGDHAPVRALDDPDPRSRTDAVYALADGGGDGAHAALARALLDTEAPVRAAAVEALADLGGARAVRSLARALNDADPDIRAEAAAVLGEIGGETAVGLLLEAGTDPDPRVRETAAQMLAELP